MKFRDFDIDERLLHVLDEQGIVTPTPIQEKAIPVALNEQDIVGVAQTGTGKTLAFSLPSLTRLARGKVAPYSVLVLTPTRELARQVHTVMDDLAHPLGIHTTCIYGGVKYDKQLRDLERGAAVVVATPGRLIDHVQRRNLDLQKVEIFILDEADRMLDMGFLPDIQRIESKMSKNRQTLMFSATFPPEIQHFANRMMQAPERITAGQINKPVDAVKQRLYGVRAEDKMHLLQQIAQEEHIESALVFMRTKPRVERVAKLLRKQGFEVQSIHGDRSQQQRQRALEDFRTGKCQFLVATDVAARGLDIGGVSHVINYDIPENSDDYLHRIGRTARASAEGDAITFVSPNEHIHLEQIERALGRNLEQEKWEHAVRVLSLFHPKTKGKRKAARRPGRMLRRR